jgi:tRNA pseudouridine55 synthase
VIDGILAVDKPLGWTSHDVVARVRRIAGQRQVGHAGTLDPLATGLLLVVLGAATKLSSYLMDTEKTYRAELMLGVSTTTDDAEGEIARRSTVPELAADEIRETLEKFQGEFDQVPPAYSAVRQGGERLYKLVRRGEDVSPRPRRVVIHEIALELVDLPRLRMVVRCGSGTYIRALARDVGDALGTGGHLCALRRISSGSFVVDEAVSIEVSSREAILRSVAPLDRALPDWPTVVLSTAEASRVRHGQAVTLGGPAPGNVRLYGPDGDLVALGRSSGVEVRPFRVFARAESGEDGH